MPIDCKQEQLQQQKSRTKRANKSTHDLNIARISAYRSSITDHQNYEAERCTLTLGPNLNCAYHIGFIHINSSQRTTDNKSMIHFAKRQDTKTMCRTQGGRHGNEKNTRQRLKPNRTNRKGEEKARNCKPI